MNNSLEYQYTPRLAVPDFHRYIEKESRLSDVARTERPCLLDITYGNTTRARFDLFPASASNRPSLIFVHGGYWRGRSKEEFSFIANAIDRKLANVIVIGYDLCPSVTLADIIKQIRHGLLWIQKNAQYYSLRSNGFLLCGHSAGAHLIASLLAPFDAEDKLPDGLVAHTCLISGIYEIEPVLKIAINQEIGLCPQDAHLFSPLRHRLQTRSPIDVVVGGGETSSWIFQSVDFFKAIGQQGITCLYHERPDLNHYSVLHELQAPDGYIAKLLQATIRGLS